MRGRLHFTIAIAQAGKSTFCDRWVLEPFGTMKFVDKRVYFDRSRVIVAGDDFRTALHGKAYVPEAEGFVFAAMDVAARALLNRGFDVIIDETNTHVESILRCLRIDIEATPHFIDTPVEECIRRAHEAGKAYLEEPIKRMAAQLVELKKDWPATFARLKERVKVRSTQDVTV